MQALRHPNICMFMGACTKPPNFALVLEVTEPLNITLFIVLQQRVALVCTAEPEHPSDVGRPATDCLGLSPRNPLPPLLQPSHSPQRHQVSEPTHGRQLQSQTS